MVLALLLAPLATVLADAPVTATFARVMFSGNSAIAASTLDAIGADYAGRAITDEDLQTLRKRIDDA